jgi:hypothetical protein
MNVDGVDEKVCDKVDATTGPLPSSIVGAFDAAWQMINDAGVCPPYSRGVSKWDEE